MPGQVGGGCSQGSGEEPMLSRHCLTGHQTAEGQAAPERLHHYYRLNLGIGRLMTKNCSYHNVDYFFYFFLQGFLFFLHFEGVVV
jgi:hypothetical protein